MSDPGGWASKHIQVLEQQFDLTDAERKFIIASWSMSVPERHQSQIISDFYLSKSLQEMTDKVPESLAKTTDDLQTTIVGSVYRVNLAVSNLQVATASSVTSVNHAVEALQSTISTSVDRINKTNESLEKANKRYVRATIGLSLVLLVVTAVQAFTSLLEAMVASGGWSELWTLIYYR